LLIAPFFYEIRHLEIYKKSVQREEDLFTLKSALFEALHLKKIRISEDILDQWKEVDPALLPPTFSKAYYNITRIKPEKLTDTMPKVQLLSLTLKLENDSKEQYPLYIAWEK
jgi:hypothetical protein